MQSFFDDLECMIKIMEDPQNGLCTTEADKRQIHCFKVARIRQLHFNGYNLDDKAKTLQEIETLISHEEDVDTKATLYFFAADLLREKGENEKVLAKVEEGLQACQGASDLSRLLSFKCSTLEKTGGLGLKEATMKLQEYIDKHELDGMATAQNLLVDYSAMRKFVI